MQTVPDINLIAHEGDVICDTCGQEAKFLIGPEPINDGLNRCKTCFEPHWPQYKDALTDFSDLLELILEMQARNMSLDAMYELYGNREEPEED
jgi:hypothetical protein